MLPHACVKNLLVTDALESDSGHVAVDVNEVEVGHSRVAHGLARRPGLKLFDGTGPGVRVDGQDLVGLELVAFAADAAAKAGFFCQSDELLQQRVVCFHLALLVGL